MTHCAAETGDDYLGSSQGSWDGLHTRWPRFSDPDPRDCTILDPDPDGGFPQRCEVTESD